MNNDLNNITEISFKDFINRLFWSKPLSIKYQQEKNNGFLKEFLIFDTNPNKIAIERKTNNIGGFDINYLMLGCDHSYKIKYLANCYNEYRCTKCGYVEVIDSSD